MAGALTVQWTSEPGLTDSQVGLEGQALRLEPLPQPNFFFP